MSNLTKGDVAPDWEMRDQDGKVWRLQDLRGQKVILYFYPADDTPGCTKEACDFRDTQDAWKKLGYTVLGVSPQDEKSHTNFIEKYSLNFPLLVDEGGKVADAYGTWGEKTIFGKTIVGTNRSTFVIDENGVIEHALYGVSAKNHVTELRELVGA